MYKIVIVSGSARLGRQTPKAVDYLNKVLSADSRVSAVTVLDVKEYNFPIMEERRGRNPNPPERLDEFGDIVETADALVFASPEYNGSFSGALKNTLDYFYQEYAKKPIGVCMAAAGAFSGVNASHDLQKYILTLGGFPMPRKLLVGKIHAAFDENGNPVEERLQKSFSAFAEDLLWLTEAIDNQKKRN
ncbi:MAG: NAD(P)H-dependent oxidoreductase [Bacteroidota bacterium]